MIEATTQIFHHRRLTTFGSVQTLAGQTTAGNTDNIGTDAQFSYPSGVAVSSGDTYVYVADHSNSRIRRVDTSTLQVDTVAGSSAGFNDDTGVAAQFDHPVHLAMFPDFSYILVADRNNRRIRKVVTGTYVVTTIAGDGTQAVNDATGTSAQFDMPSGIAISPNGAYAAVSEYSPVCVIRLIDLSDNSVSTIAGLANTCAYSNAGGASSRFDGPEGLAFLNNNDILVAEINNHVIRLVTIAGTTSTYCGPAAPTVSSGSDNGACTSATFDAVFSVAVSSDGSSVAVADKNNYAIRLIDTATTQVTTLAGTGVAGTTNGDLTSAQFNFPHQVAFLGNDMDIVVADATNNRIRLVDVYHSPTFAPTSIPSSVPTDSPSSLPSSLPTSMPTSPTSVPTSLPTSAPTEAVAQHIFVHAVDLHGDGWGENLFLAVGHNITDTSHHRRLLDGETSQLYTLNCACKVIRLFSYTGDMTIGMYRNVTSVNGTASSIVEYEWEAIWAVGYSNGVSVEPFSVFGGVDSEVVIKDWALNSSLRILDVNPKPCLVPPPKPKSKSSPSSSTSSNTTDHAVSSTNTTNITTPATSNSKPTPKPPPLASLDLTLSHSHRRSWCDDSGDTHMFTCSMENLLSDDALLPNSLTYPRYFISNYDNLELVTSGTMIRDVRHEYNKVKLPEDGNFVFSVSGHNTEGGEISWEFCGVSGGLSDRLQFRMRSGICEPIDFVEQLTTHSCEGEWTTGMLLLSPVIPLAASPKLMQERFELNLMTVFAVLLGIVAIVVMTKHIKDKRNGRSNKKKSKYIRLRPTVEP